MRKRLSFDGPEELPMRAASMGVKVRATQRENRVEKTTVMAKGLNICPMRPPDRATGTKTPRFVAVVERTAMAISFVPRSAASMGWYPISL